MTIMETTFSEDRFLTPYLHFLINYPIVFYRTTVYLRFAKRTNPIIFAADDLKGILRQKPI